MNKRIQELFSRAGGAIDMIDGAVLTYTDHFDPEKFAQLILGDCISWCNAYSSIDSNAQVIADSIKQQFGVE